MRTSFITFLGLGAFIVSSIASPIDTPVDISKRQVGTAAGYLNELSASVNTYTAEINSIMSKVSASSSKAEKDAATASVGSQISGLTSAIKSTTSKVKTLKPVRTRNIEARQTAGSITAILTALLNQIFGALTNAIATLGLTGLLSFLTPLVQSLGGLVLALEVVVDQLLTVVRALLDGLLTGLGLGLIGLGL